MNMMNRLLRFLKIKGKPTFALILITYILLAICPVIILGSVSYTVLNINVEKGVIEANVERVQQIMASIDGLFDNVEEKALTLFMDESVYSLKNIGYDDLTTVDDIMNIRKFQDKVNDFMLSSKIIDSVYFYNHDTDFVITRNTSVPFKEFADTEPLKSMDYAPRGYWGYLRSVPLNGNYVLSYNKVSSTYLSNVNGTITVNINVKALNEVGTALTRNSTGNLFILDKSGRVISNQNNQLINEILDEDIIENIGDKKTGYITLDKEDDSYIYYYSVSPKGFIYVLKNPANNLLNISENFGFLTFILGVILIILGVIISVYLSRMVYNPIDKIIYTIKSISMQGSIKGSNEFDLIDKVIKDMYSEGDNLRNFLGNNIQSIKENSIRMLIYGGVTDIEDLHTKLSYCGIKMENDKFCSLLIKVKEPEKMPERNEELAVWQSFLIKICESQSNSSFTCIGTMVDFDRIVLIVNADDVNQIKKISNSIIELIKNRFNMSVNIVVGGVYNNILEVSNSYRDALRIYDYRMLIERDSALFYNEIEIKDGILPKYPFELEEKIISSIKAGSSEEIMPLLSQLVNDINLHTDNNRSLVVGYCIQFISYVLRTVELSGTKPEDITKRNIYKEFMENSDSIEDIEEWLKEFLGEIVDSIYKDFGKYKKYEDVIKAYIQENYNKDISMESVADSAGISYSYLRRIFIKMFGCSFSYYINMIRIEKAKEILRDTELNAYEVSEKIGYNNVQIFHKNFKKYTGYTPMDYKKSHTGNLK